MKLDGRLENMDHKLIVSSPTNNIPKNNFTIIWIQYFCAKKRSNYYAFNYSRAWIILLMQGTKNVGLDYLCKEKIMKLHSTKESLFFCFNILISFLLQKPTKATTCLVHSWVFLAFSFPTWWTCSNFLLPS